MSGEKLHIVIETLTELREWLEENHGHTDSVWLITWKKGRGPAYLSYDDIVDELICFGWVDSLPRKLDGEKTMRRISPRNPKSNWSRVNKDRVGRLEQLGRIQVSGRKLIEMAKENGAWSFLDDVENLVVPPDLDKALRQHEMAHYYFERFPKSSKRNILEWIKIAKLPTTRQRRIEETALKAAKNIKANHPSGRDKGPALA